MSPFLRPALFVTLFAGVIFFSYPAVLSNEHAIDDPIQELVSTLSLEQKVGQMFMLGMFSDDIEGWKQEFLQEKNIGGVILHPYNVREEGQIKAFVKTLQEGAPHQSIPLFIAVNQEGGEIMGIKFAGEKRGGRMIQDEGTAFEVGLARAKELRGWGVNVNFAPVVDVVAEPNSFLYTRSFSENPVQVASTASSYIKGQREGGIISCIKHFPGHGVSLGDSHVNIPISYASREEIEKHLIPFRKAIEEGTEMIMATHMVFPLIDKENVPFSRVFLTDLLRNELGFEGVIITDDLEMKAVRNLYSLDEAVIKAVEAGVDIMTISGILENQRKGYDALLAAVRSGRVSEERINQSLERILLLKAKIGAQE